jgi:hypothetical protein
LTVESLSSRSYVGFPPGSGLLMLPASPPRAARAGLALYEAVERRQRFALAGMNLLTRIGLQTLMPNAAARAMDWGWWERWIDEVARPVVGAVGHVAVRIPATARVCVLLMDRDGRPTGFAKILDAEEPEQSSRVLKLLAEAGPRSFRVPAILAEGVFDGTAFSLSEPLPEGPHRRPPRDVVRVRAVLDEFTDHLSPIERPPAVPAHHVLCHTGFTPRNLRVTGDGGWWLFDLDNVRWGPRLAAELRYWSADFAYRARPRVGRAAAHVLRLLRERGTDDEIREAVHWPGHTRTYRHVEREIHLRVAELAG